MKLFIFLYMVLLSFSIGQNKKDKIVFDNKESYQDYFKLLEKSFKYLKVNYVDSLNESEIVKEGIKGFSKQLDPYTKLLSGKSKEKYDDLRRGKYGGVGIQLGMRRDTLTILSVFENSPAYSEGLLVGDDIMMVDSTSTSGLSLKECLKVIKGEIDSVVTFHVYRKLTKEKLKFDLVRSNVALKNVPYWGVNENNVGYIRMTRFSKNSDKDFKLALNELNDLNMNGLIIDLRGNSGGLLSVAINILDYLTDRGEILLVQKGKTNRSNKEWKSKRRPVVDLDIPIVVLINKSSASASEIVAGSLQDLDRALVVGEKSFGKGLVQNMYNLNDSLVIKITTAKFYLPSGRLIQKQDYLNNGFLTDGLDKKDTPFTTKMGREVKGGGGITPDFLVKKKKINPFINALWREKVFLAFASDYLSGNKDISVPIIINDDMKIKFSKFVENFDLKYKFPIENNL